MATTGTIGRVGTPLNIRLGQSPNIDDPATNVELQQVYNALHLLSEYMAALRENLESADGQTPSESIRFRRTFWATAAQTITTGAIVSCFDNAVYNGVYSRNPAIGIYSDSSVTVGSTGSRALFNLVPLMFGLALTDAAPGELVRIGIGPGVIQLATAKCGQIVWAVDAKAVFTTRAANDANQVYSGVRTLVNNGGLYLANVTGSYAFVGATAHWEGYWMPGFPNAGGGGYNYNRAFLYPIGVCIADGYVMFSDYKRSDPIPLTTYP